MSSYGQEEWSRVRAYGLLGLLSWICRQGSKPVSISALLARQYVSPIKRPKDSRTILEPLPLLCHIGYIEKTAAGVHWHVMASAKYRLAADLAGKVHQFTELFPPKIAHKLATADERKEKRLGDKHEFRDQLLADLGRLVLAHEARAIIARMHRTKRGGSGLQNIIAAIDGRMHSVTVDTLGTINTSISSLPRELKPLLTIDTEAAVSCDVSHAHHCFLPRLLSDRMNYIRTHHPDRKLDAMRAEHQRLVLMLSGPDYYRQWCKDPTDDAERQAKKGLINSILNMPNCKCTENGFYRWMRSEFPICFAIVEAIKLNDHRNLSKQLQRYTSNAINGALVELQKESIAAIPQTDAIITIACHADRVREVVGQHVHRESSGVRCKVNGILTEGTAGWGCTERA